MEGLPAQGQEQSISPDTLKDIRINLVLAAGKARIISKKRGPDKLPRLPKARRDLRGEHSGVWITGSVLSSPYGTRRDPSLIGVVTLQQSCSIGLSERFELHRTNEERENNIFSLEKFVTLSTEHRPDYCHKAKTWEEFRWKMDQYQQEFTAQDESRQYAREIGVAAAGEADAQFLLVVLRQTAEAYRQGGLA